MTMDQLKPGQQARVRRLRADGSMRRRLQDLGLTPGNEVCCRLISPLGDPTAYEICGALIAIRRDDAKTVELDCQL
ncbi:ferrous iron transport protein A [Oscillospiraceae bacterium HV4-5-C5C]|nr:ferrous iron transport protein A [Oscillospiraceae bacterium HV4-5-C5C]